MLLMLPCYELLFDGRDVIFHIDAAMFATPLSMPRLISLFHGATLLRCYASALLPHAGAADAALLEVREGLQAADALCHYCYYFALILMLILPLLLRCRRCHAVVLR